jgi:hypothetical protein
VETNHEIRTHGVNEKKYLPSKVHQLHEHEIEVYHYKFPTEGFVYKVGYGETISG